MFILSDESHATKTREEYDLVLIQTEPNGIPTYIILSPVEVTEYSSSNADCFVKGRMIFLKTKNPSFIRKKLVVKRKQYHVIQMIGQVQILEIEEFWYSLKQHEIGWLQYTV